MANLSQRASFMPATERAIPALLRKSLLYFWGKRRQALPVEHFEMQGWNIFGNPQPRDEEGDQQLRQALISLPPGKQQELSGNGMHLHVLGSVLLFTLAFSEKVNHQDNQGLAISGPQA